jgi:hypothetical protein
MPSHNCNCCIIPSPEPEDQPSAPAPPPANWETFNLDIVSGSKDQEYTKTGDSIHVNDPDKAMSAWIKSTVDIEYFFDKMTKAKTFCKECR